MKKLVIAVAVSALAFCLTAPGAFAQETRNNVGCGLGTMVLGETKSTVAIQVLAATTNSILGNQTFGITSGTLGCDQPDRWVSNELQNFVTANIDGLAKDIAAGRGESLDTLAELMEIPAAERTGFNRKLQSNFARIFSSDAVQSADVIDNIFAVLES